MAAEALTAAGYEHYEVSNFARPGARARHNAVYWQGEPYLGLGNGAHSFAPPVRRWNLRSWDTYRDAVTRGAPAEAGREVLDDAARRLEAVWLALRTDAGWPSDDLEAGSRGRTLLDAWVADGLALEDHGRVRLTPSGWLLLDRLAVDLDLSLVG